jgi:hypothetical protein
MPPLSIFQFEECLLLSFLTAHKLYLSLYALINLFLNFIHSISREKA